ncbi:MAG: hypothetical protein A2087_01635 [Spirochaetes bacterium GWD1_61_31]|nr:MAG: hypothetical protein A2Y37_10450 [Spirochaetes bacterium GWB1_60_80]OHD29744.1 MAG: hypothetical protein A2004_04725 [Spirochaetes bacterium GWC1_61_12]OHD35776.1 MAG: hypothetical protein A2087_01635 [Spirochaetes bacterium GWD1_61_31]OHD42913.1 MAG: hypothetical protein A2Y35_14070 [Spirochaetes bacterium GWE1_60_18]OHD61287.1 MAG: hypothetical protein A2Y32_04145 [Spirochaetes bacterium GWF1_60_12]HAP43781.1 hypothetical protein [Spirochaetaceae bacterium]
MNCVDFLVALDALDAQAGSLSALPIAIRHHAAGCPDCRLVLERQARALALCRLSPISLQKDICQRVMTGVLFAPRPQPVMPLRNWLAAGIVLLAAAMVSPLLHDYRLLQADYGNSFIIPLTLVLGAAISLYMLVFVGSHLRDFSTIWRRWLSSHR